MNLSDMDDAELEHALRLLLTEFCVRNALPQSELYEAIEHMFVAGVTDNMYPVEAFEHPASKEILTRLTTPGIAYALLTGRTEVRYRARSGIEYDMLVRSLFSPRSPMRDRDG